MSKTASKGTVNFRDFERNNDDVKKAEHLKLPLDRIRKKKGFNPRDLTKPETVEKIQGIKQAYIKGQYVPPILVKMAQDGEGVEIVDGECRFTAAQLAHAEIIEAGGPGLLHLEVMRFNGNDKEALIQTVISNEGERLTPLEQSEVVKRLQSYGLNREQIADELHKSIGWIDRLIVVAKLPERIKKLVRDGKVAPEVAVKFVKQYGEENAEAEILKKLNGGKDTGTGTGDGEGDGEGAEAATPAKKAKVTAKDAEGEDSPAKVKKERLAAAKDAAFFLPEKLTRKKPENIKDTEEVTVVMSGAALKALMKLQDLYDAEITEAYHKQKQAA